MVTGKILNGGDEIFGHELDIKSLVENLQKYEELFWKE
jgi:hypothetical protein